jgi:tryptophan synthase alpha chain
MNTSNPFAKPHKQLSIFLTAGYPELNSLHAQLELLEASDVDFVEVGIPFSDPLADGPVIQDSSAQALRNGMHLELLFLQLAQRRSKIPLVLMGYLNPILNFGLERFLNHCETVGIDTVILPDMSPEIYRRLYQKAFEKTTVRNVFIVTPQTDPARLALIAELCTSRFIYLVSGNSTTGGHLQTQLPEARIAEIRSACAPVPVFIGFGIQHAEDLQRVHRLADGAIIGSAFLRSISQNSAKEFLQKIAQRKKNDSVTKK